MPGRNLVDEPPVFSSTWIKKLKIEYDLKERVSRSINYLSTHFNMDETVLDAKWKWSSKHQVADHSLKKRERWNTSAWIFVFLLVEDISNHLPFSLKTLPYLDATASNFFFTGQQNGFIDNDIWLVWIRDVFISHFVETSM